MRRSAPTGPLSPKLIKHFAAATIALTGLLAIFASGEDWGASAQVSAVEAHNQLLAIEAEQLGTRRLAAKVKIMPGPSRLGFDDEPGADFGDRGGESAAPAPTDRSVQPRSNRNMPPPGLAGAPGATVVVNGSPANASDTTLTKPKTSARPAPTAQELAEITGNSARRSGQSGEPD